MIGLALDVRNARLLAIRDGIDRAGKAGKLCIYAGARPYTGGPAGVKLAECALSYPCAGEPEDGVLVFDPVAMCKSASAGGKAGWARITDGSGGFVVDCSVGKDDGDIRMKSLDVYEGMAVEVKRAAIWEGNG